MTGTLRFTLVSEGTSDRALVPLLRWVLAQHARPDLEPDGEPVDTSRLPTGMIATPADRLRSAVAVYPCDVLFIHRDADRADWVESRRDEVRNWVTAAGRLATKAVIPVIPLRMTEAWLLADESAIRRAAGNPGGKMSLNLPPLARLESEPNPKAVLFEALRAASGRAHRRLKSFNVYSARGRVADHITDPGRLRRLSAFTWVEAEVKATCERHGWGG